MQHTCSHISIIKLVNLITFPILMVDSEPNKIARKIHLTSKCITFKVRVIDILKIRRKNDSLTSMSYSISIEGNHGLTNAMD